MRICVFVETFGIFTCISRKIGTGSAGWQLSNNLIPHYLSRFSGASAVSVHCKDKTDDRMTKEFLLHKDKKGNENPPHIQAHLAIPTHANTLQPKELSFC